MQGLGVRKGGGVGGYSNRCTLDNKQRTSTNRAIPDSI